MNISKELLSEVLNINVQTEIHEDDWCSDNTLIYWEFDGYHNDYKTINIYELEHRCIEWAFNEGYACLVGIDICYVMRLEGFNIDYFTQLSKDFSNVFKACQWILDNKDSK